MIQAENIAHPFSQSVGGAVRRERENLGWSQIELAVRAGLSRSTVGKVEAGTGNPRAITLNRIKNAGLDIEIPSSLPKTFGAALRQARIAKGLSTEALSEVAQIDRLTIIRAEASQSMPSFGTVKMLLGAGLDIDLSLIVKEDLTDSTSLGHFMRIARQRQLLSHLEVQRLTGVTKLTLIRIENDQNVPQPETFKRLTSVYQLTVEDPEQVE